MEAFRSKIKKELLTAKIEYKLAIDIKLNKQKMKGKREWYIDKPGIKDCIIDYDDQRLECLTRPVQYTWTLLRRKYQLQTTY